MARFDDQHLAGRLIADLCRLNNRIISEVNELVDLRQQLVDLTTEERDRVVQAVQERGYDPTEIQTMLAEWLEIQTAIRGKTELAMKKPVV